MKIGDVVERKITGLPGTGVVSGLIDAKKYMYQVASAHLLRRWNDLYHGWYKKPVVLVTFEKPRKTMTLEELRMTLIREGFTELEEEDITKIYEAMPEMYLIAYPIDDLNIKSAAYYA